MKDIKDYLHLYFGQSAMFRNKEWKIIAYNHAVEEVTIDCEDAIEVKNVCKNINEVKPVLRPLSDMTDEEWNAVEDEVDIFFDARGIDMVKNNFIIDMTKDRMGWTCINEALIALRKRGIDVDGLIESGIAIDKTKI